MKPIPSGTPNRRAHERSALRIGVTLVFTNGFSSAARCLDISKGGMGVVAELSVPVGARLRVQARLPVAVGSPLPFEADAFVSNSVLAGAEGGFRLGLQFLELPPPARDALTACLKR